MTSSFISSIFHSVTFSGMVKIRAICSGTPTSLIEIFGSGEITVRAEKSTLFPDRLPLKRPSLPRSLCVSVLKALPDLCLAGGIPATSLSI